MLFYSVEIGSEGGIKKGKNRQKERKEIGKSAQGILRKSL